MKAWLLIHNQPAFDTSSYFRVFRRADAAEMTERQAQETICRAAVDHPAYKWEMVKIPGSEMFVVEGTMK
jgi:hypothetical protein